VVDVEEAVGTSGIVGLGSCVAEIGDLVGLEAIGDAHFVEVGITGKGKEAGVLIFPAEAADSGMARSFDNGNVENLAANLVSALRALFLGEIYEGLVGESFDEAVAEKIERDAEGANIFGVRGMLLDFGAGERAAGADGAVIDQGTALDDFRAVGKWPWASLWPTRNSET
jgi:hypothetical protein